MRQMPETTQIGLDELDDEKAFDLLFGSSDDRRRAGYYYYAQYHEEVFNIIRSKFRSLPSDLIADAVHDAFIVFIESATTDQSFDPVKPVKLVVRVAFNKACDIFRKRTGRGKFKEECFDEIADTLVDTDVGRAWSEAARAGLARDLQSDFHRELEKCGDRQRKVGRLMVDRLTEDIPDVRLAELYRETYGEPITVPSAKRAREEVRKKFKTLLDGRNRRKS